MLLQDKPVVHVSFNQKSDYVITWYQDIFNEMSKKKNLADAEEVKETLMKHRVILNFSQESITAARVISTLKALAEGGTPTACLIIDGFDMTKFTAADYAELKAYAKDAGMVIWFSCNSDNDVTDKILPADIAAEVDAVIYLEQKPDTIQMKVLKAKDSEAQSLNLKLDSKTLLISEK